MDPVVRESLISLLNQQFGLASLPQMRELGVTRSDLQAARRQRLLERVAPSTWASPAAPRSFDFARMLALLACPDAMLSHRCAAQTLGFDRFTANIVEVTGPRGIRGRTLPFGMHTTNDIGPLDRITVGPFVCTSGTRTVVDLARFRVPVIQLEAAIDSSVRLGWSSPLVIVTRLSELRGPGQWGAPLLDQLLLDSGGHTMLERRFLQLVRRAGLPRPLTQVIYRRDGRTFARVDFSWPELAVVVEVSGRKGHASDAERARDAQRRNELQDIGRRVYEYTWAHVTQRGDWVIDTLRRRLNVA